ncbi:MULTISPECIES: DOMON-like domain-containing protein [unclassified Sphingomonas]|uniref:DOMON-like domain-containing protein n=1 Tax=unclassified Sphingomonas TaxID=196159 RepID=UPI002151419D|nr:MULTISPECIES: DOMON-like domain-containing protein [unclassified Sphingomonas]MCR5869724.1 DOMON-like domain-containing protein [Sphingomonas sp. J344]UUX98570.1 DOMON-like domain-containing protein [Sphingomonas sp. J315]
MEWKLIAHPSGATPKFVVSASYRQLDSELWAFSYRVTGAVSGLVVPRPGRASPARTDNLWQTTCFEAFARVGGECAYREFNFSPSGDWAVYAFDDYRRAMTRPLVGQELTVMAIEDSDCLVVEAIFARRELAGGDQLNLTAVIEETDGTKSYWALAHPGDRPDFHHPDGFVLELPGAA